MSTRIFKDYMRLIKADLFRYDGAMGIKGYLKNYFREPGFRYNCWIRTADFLDRNIFLKVPYWLACFSATPTRNKVRDKHTSHDQDRAGQAALVLHL